MSHAGTERPGIKRASPHVLEDSRAFALCSDPGSAQDERRTIMQGWPALEPSTVLPCPCRAPCVSPTRHDLSSGSVAHTQSELDASPSSELLVSDVRWFLLWVDGEWPTSGLCRSREQVLS